MMQLSQENACAYTKQGLTHAHSHINNIKENQF
jgi:hypothetical protein